MVLTNIAIGVIKEWSLPLGLYENEMVWRKDTEHNNSKYRSQWKLSKHPKKYEIKMRPQETDWQGVGGFLFSWKDG